MVYIQSTFVSDKGPDQTDTDTYTDHTESVNQTYVTGWKLIAIVHFSRPIPNRITLALTLCWDDSAVCTLSEDLLFCLWRCTSDQLTSREYITLRPKKCASYGL